MRSSTGPSVFPAAAAPALAAAAAPGRESYARALAACVRDDGVDYEALRARAADLIRFLDENAGPLPAFRDAADRAGFYIDAYNACVLDEVRARPALAS